MCYRPGFLNIPVGRLLKRGERTRYRATPRQGVRTPQTPSSAIVRGGTNRAAYGLQRHGETLELSVEHLIYY